MKNRKLGRFLAMATAVTVLTTTVLPQGVVYASEPTGITSELDVSEDDSEIPSEESVESTETETPSEEIVENTETEISENVVEEPTEENLEDETEETSKEEASSQKEDAEDEIADVAVEEEAEETGAGEIPTVGQVVQKNTVIVEKADPDNGKTDTKNWKLVWSDEFNEGKLDTTKWGYQVGNGSAYGVAGWGNNELEYYTDNDENISFEDGQLVITAKKNNQHGSEWTSAKLWTQGQAYYDGETDEPLFAKKYGRIEAKMTLPAGTGLWPAFWMMPLDDKYGGWASSGEIDIMEARGRLTNSIDGTIHFGNASPNNKNRGGQYDEAKASSEAAQNFDFTEEHEYAIEWLPGQIKWYVDDECYYTTSNWYSTSNGNGDNFTYPAPFDQEFFIMLNLAVGGNYDSGAMDNTLTEASMKVDYVRVYDLCDDASGTVHDYAEDEKTVSATSSSSGTDGLLGGKEIGENYLTGNLQEAHKSVADQDEKATSGDTPNNEGWYLLTTGDDAAATVSGMSEDGYDVAKVNVTAAGSQTYSIQLSHQLPLTQGYSYKLSFEAKADAARSITADLSDYVYTNFDGSWTKYSDTTTAALTTEWKKFEFTFDMIEQSDEYTRLELNLGAGGTGNVYFRNAELVATGKTEAKSEDAEKVPLSNGEHIYNGTFDQGNNRDENNEYTRMIFWKLVGGAQGSVANDATRSLLLTPGTSADAGIQQENVQLLAREEYKLTFDASGSRDITVNIVGSDGTVYATETVNAAKGQEIIFTVPDTASGDYGNIQFIVGNAGGSVTLDNVSMTRETNCNADWSGMWEAGDFYLDNYDFSKGQEGWFAYNDGSGSAWGWVNNGGYPNNLDIRDNGWNIQTFVPQDGVVWCVGLQSPAVNVKALINYKLRFKITDVELQAQGSVKDKKTLLIQMPDGTTTTCEIEAGDNDEIVIPFTSKSDIEGGKVEIQLGANSATEYGNYNFVLEYLDFSIDVENNEKNGIPEEYKKLRAPKLQSVSGVELGKSVAIKHNDDNWGAHISKVYVNDVEIDLDKVSATAGRVMLAADVFDKAGSYTIRFEAEGYLDAEAITQEIFEAQGNVMANGTFESTIDGWETYFANWNNPNIGSAEAKGGEAVISVNGSEYDETGTCVSWSHQFKQANISTTHEGKYVLSFDAYATKERPIQLEFANLGTASNTIVDLTTEKQTYAIVLTDVPVTTEGSINFLMGNVNDCLLDFGSIGVHEIHLDNISLQIWSQEDEDEFVASTLSLANSSTPLIGQDIVFDYTENPVWEQKEIAVTVDGTAVASDKVQKDTESNTITIDGTLFTAAKSYTISVKADGYSAQSFKIWVAADESNLFPGEMDIPYDGKADRETGTITTKAFGFDVSFEKTIVASWGSPMFWTMQARADNIITERRKTYVLEFDADLTYADSAIKAERGLTIEFGDSSNQQVVEITPGKNHYKCEVTPGAKKDFYILFMAGGAELYTAKHTLDVSNIKFAEKVDDAVVNAAVPEIKTQPVGKTYTVGDTAAALTVVAQSADGGSLSYQWYKNSINGSVGATKIAGATQAAYTPSASAAGTTYYYCEVTNTNNAVNGTKTASVNSSIAAIVVNAKNTSGGNTSGGNTAVKVTGVTLNKTALTLAKGKTTTLTATVAPANAANKAVTWKSSKTKVATVDANGKIKAVGKGTAVITVTTADGSKTATCKVTVNIPSTKVKLNTKNVYVVAGKSVSVKATMTPLDSTDKVTWSSNKKTVATVKNGKITTKKNAANKTATITVKTTSGKKATVKVHVVKKAKKSTSIKLNKKTLSLKKGAQYDIVPTLKPSTSTDIVKWKSSNKKVVSVDAFGTVVGKKGGTATITATTTSGKKYTCKVTVKVASTKVKLNKTKLTLKAGKTATLKATKTPSDSTDTLKWSTSNKKVVTVDSKGKIKGIKKGTATITVKTSSGKKATCKVTVK